MCHYLSESVGTVNMRCVQSSVSHSSRKSSVVDVVRVLFWIMLGEAVVSYVVRQINLVSPSCRKMGPDAAMYFFRVRVHVWGAPPEHAVQEAACVREGCSAVDGFVTPGARFM